MANELREQLARVDPTLAHLLLFQAAGSVPPPSNQLSIVDTFHKFVSEFLPRCPIIDPRGKLVRIRKDNFPKFLNLNVRLGVLPRKPSTIVQMIEDGKFDAEEYEWAKDRIRALFWVPEVITDPDAIYLKKISHGLIRANEVYVKLYCKMGSNVKLVFVDYFGKSRHPTFITSFLTDSGTAVKYCAGQPLYRRK